MNRGETFHAAEELHNLDQNNGSKGTTTTDTNDKKRSRTIFGTN